MMNAAPGDQRGSLTGGRAWFGGGNLPLLPPPPLASFVPFQSLRLSLLTQHSPPVPQDQSGSPVTPYLGNYFSSAEPPLCEVPRLSGFK